MARFKDLTDNLDRALRDAEVATERVVQRASAYVETSLAKAQTRALGLPAWLALLADPEPTSPPFGLPLSFVDTLDVSTGRLRVFRLEGETKTGATEGGGNGTAAGKSAREDLVVGPGPVAIQIARAQDGSHARYLVLRFGPERVTVWTLFAERRRDERLHVRNAVELSRDDFTSALAGRQSLAQGIARFSLGLAFGPNAWRSVFLGRDARGTLAAMVFDLEPGTERPRSG